MDSNFSNLELVLRVREGFGDPSTGEAYKTERRFFDFVVDGRSLYDTLGQPRDLISVLWQDPTALRERDLAVNRLLLFEPGNASEGRVPVFNCPECGDLGCGAITVRIQKHPDGIIWQAFGYENDYEPDVDLASFVHLGPFRFDPVIYEQKLRALVSE